MTWPPAISSRGVPAVMVFGVLAVMVLSERLVTAQAGSSTLLMDRAQEAMRRVVAVRGLPQKRVLCRRIAGQPKLVSLIRERVRSQYSDEELAREGQILHLLGILESPDDYADRVFAAMNGTVGGYYDPVGECLYISRWLDPDDEDEVLHHETAHALQDQHFDLDRLLRHEPGHSDRLAAVSALVEGDATATALAATTVEGVAGLGTRRWSSDLRQRLAGFPSTTGARGGLEEHLRRAATFNYADGLEFVSTAYVRRGWAAVNAHLTSPPASTEQVLHPERRDVASRPVALTLSMPGELPAGCRVVFEDTLGEQLLGEALEGHVPRAAAQDAVVGWGGDRAGILEGCGGPASRGLVVSTVWDEGGAARPERAAVSFQSALHRSIARNLGSSEGPATATTTVFQGRRRRVVVTVRRGRRVSWVVGLPVGIARAVAEAAVGF